MKIIEKKKELEIDLPKINADQHFTYYNKKTKKYERADWLDRTPLMSSTFFYAIVGLAGSGKTSLMTSMITSKKESSKAYHGVFDNVYLNMPKESLKSIASKNFDTIPEEQLYEEFDLNFIEKFTDIVKDHRKEDEDTILIIDDAVTRLKNNKAAMDKFIDFVNLRRHYRCSIIILVQDLIMLPLPIRNALNSLMIFEPVNLKRVELLRTEYLNMEINQFRDFTKYIWQRKGDFLMVRLSPRPCRYYKNFHLLEFHCNCNEGENCKCFTLDF